jgi:2-hydroxymuconate-semialdehyde hydrolase
MSRMRSRYVLVDGIKTYYLEGGDGPILILLHSGEFGACGEITWEFNLEALAEHFHVLAPDWLGYGRSAKLFSFEDMWAMRVWHIRRFMDSMGASTLITVAADKEPEWPMDRIVVVSGGGNAPENEMRRLLNTYDCTREHMRKIVKGLFLRPEIRDSEDYVEKRYQASLEPGAWECTAAVRFKSPVAKPKGPRRPDSYGGIKAPTLLVAGAKDNLRAPNYAEALRDQIPGAKLHVFERAGHCPQIDVPDAFNRLVIDFLLDQ